MSKIIIYDFDGTLTPYAIPRYEILEKCGIKDGNLEELYLEVVAKAKQENIDLYISLYNTYFQIIKENEFKVDDNNLCLGSDKVIYNKGVYEFFEYLEENNIKNYLVSSGIKVFLERTSIGKFFDGIYATTFKYNDDSEIIDIDYLMSDINKKEAIKDIISINNYSKDDCRDIIYIGDGLTDISAMEYVKKNGGTTIFIYNNDKVLEKEIIKSKNIVSFFASTDFSVDSSLNNYIKKIIKEDIV